MKATRSKRWAGWVIAGLVLVVAAGPAILGLTQAHRSGLIGSAGLRPLVRAVTSPFFIRMAAIAGGSLAAIIGLFVLLGRVGRRQRRERESLGRSETGATAVEFALVLPVVTAVVLMLVQSMPPM